MYFYAVPIMPPLLQQSVAEVKLVELSSFTFYLDGFSLGHILFWQLLFLLYLLATDDTSLFTINNITGVITVSGSLDREGVPGENVELQVVAREKNLNIYHEVAQVSTMVTIQVTDVNDNTPQFYLCTYLACNFSALPESNFSGQIEEHASPRTPVANLNIVAYDPDKGANGTFQLTLQGPDASAFSVSPQQIVNEGAVQVLIVANDTGKTTDCCSFATVTIHLIDINDHGPEFERNDYKLSVLEKSPPGTVVSSNITATDPDSGLFGEITYQLLPPSIHTTFTVNAISGTVLVANGSHLDWRTRPIYYATLQATDGGNLTGFTQLEISVIDINDNPPTVIGSYMVFVTEGDKMEPVQILATDQDDPESDNSHLQFKILPGKFSSNFTINADTGELSSHGPLDREAIPVELDGKMVVTVLVHDMGIPQLNTTVNVTIVVEDINDNAPRFNSTFYEFFIPEGLKGIVGRVEATDADQTEINNRISFYIETSAGSNNFAVRSLYLGPGWYQGVLSLAIAFDYDQMPQKFLNLTVQAENLESGGTVGIDTAVVTVNVQDVNDEPPTLVPSPPHDIDVLENATLDGLVTSLEAQDMDTNHSLVFEKLAVACFKGSTKEGSVCQNWFHLDLNGSLFVNSSEISYTTCDLVELTLRVKDEFTEEGDPYSKNETLRILIIDVNDNPPIIRSHTDYIVFPFSFQATDADSGLNGVITFSLSKVVCIEDNGLEQNYESPFKVVSTVNNGNYTGSIQIASSRSLKGQCRVTVEAKDHGTPPLNSSVTLDILTVDQSKRVKLEFNAPVETVKANSTAIEASLMRATRVAVYIVAIKESLPASRTA
ncbi:hypothetical protein JRQ81_002732, partial [Phrynocephalus forsythii]